MVPAIPVAHVPRAPWSDSLKASVQSGAGPRAGGRTRSFQELPFPVLWTETLGYHCAANRISTLLPDYHAFYMKPN